MFHQSCPKDGYFSRLTTAPAHARYGAAAALLLAACAGDVVDVGENTPYPVGTQCRGDTTVRGSVIVENQEQLNELAGCSVIEGNLDIVPFRDADLRALHALVRVDGDVVIGSRVTEPPPFEFPDDREELDLIHRLNLRQSEQRRARGPQWLATLEGLERLETVGSLTIEAPLDNLEALTGLRTITSGRLAVISTEFDDRLNDLTGLEALRGVTDLQISGRISDLTALRLPASMTSLNIAAPIEALDVSDVRSVSHLVIEGVLLEDLDMFQGLEQAGQISVIECPFLRHMDGLNGVRGVGGNLDVSGNLSLERLPESFNSIEQLESLRIADNPRLERLPEFTMLEGLTSFHVIPHSIGSLRLRELPAFPRMNLPGAAPVHLEVIGVHRTLAPSFVMPRAWKSAGWIYISNNEEMTELDLGGLETVERLLIEGNNKLTHLTLNSLTHVEQLELAGNPQLSSSLFDGVQFNEDGSRN